jgi:hydrogenase expression/formation protein HypE
MAEEARKTGVAIVAGDAIIVSSTIGDHSIAVLAVRGELGITVPINSDCASL